MDTYITFPLSAIRKIKRVLSQVLNNYDQETIDFYRWKVSYTQQELSALVHKRSGINFGEIIDLIPVERGTSGRLVRLKIVGTFTNAYYRKELEIHAVPYPLPIFIVPHSWLTKKGKGQYPPASLSPEQVGGTE